MNNIHTYIYIYNYTAIKMNKISIFFLLGFLTEGVLVVVHPYLEDLALDPGFVAEIVHSLVVLSLDPPPDRLGKAQHLVFLILSEFRSESLL